MDTGDTVKLEWGGKKPVEFLLVQHVKASYYFAVQVNGEEVLKEPKKVYLVNVYGKSKPVMKAKREVIIV